MVLCYRRNPEPETRSDTVADTVIAIREAQRVTAISLETWLRHPNASFGNRLAAAMDSEKELYDLIFNPDAFDDHTHVHKTQEQPRPKSNPIIPKGRPRPISNPDPVIPKASPKKPSVWPTGARKLTEQQRR